MDTSLNSFVRRTAAILFQSICRECGPHRGVHSHTAEHLVAAHIGLLRNSQALGSQHGGNLSGDFVGLPRGEIRQGQP